jgi:short subunit dehydrogenase-like uncharacterized protein
MTQGRDFDIVLWGATGFVGRRVAHHIAQRMTDGATLRLALGGRDRAGLARLRAQLPEAGREAPLLVGDSHDAAFIDDLAARTRLVCSAVGPYAKYGTELVEACVRHGTDYSDISGETYWIRRMIDAHQADAERSGARLLHATGFDSVPSDMGVFALQREAEERSGRPCPRVRMRVKWMRGGLNGGTAASFLYRNEMGAEDADVWQVMDDPYCLNPEGQRRGPDRPTHQTMAAALDEGLAAWTMPFVMAPINTRIVRRGNALRGYPYGEDFRYEEAMLTGGGTGGWIAASLGAFATRAFTRVLRFAMGRRLLSRVLPKPGQGPSEEVRRTGGFEMLFIGDLVDGGELRLGIRGEGDPNTESTSKLMAETALCLAQDDIDVGGGFWTPASALGEALLKRLVEHEVLHLEWEGAAAVATPPARPVPAREPEPSPVS